MIDLRQIDYLKTGNAKQQKVYEMLVSANVMTALEVYSPVLTGTIPIAIDTDESDLDIICYWIDIKAFKETLKQFSLYPNYELNETIVNGYHTVISRFKVNGFAVEIFGQNRPVEQQEAYRHLVTEANILSVRGESFKQEIIALKKKGIKTEPAFGILLGLKNPYEELLSWPDK